MEYTLSTHTHLPYIVCTRYSINKIKSCQTLNNRMKRVRCKTLHHMVSRVNNSTCGLPYVNVGHSIPACNIVDPNILYILEIHIEDTNGNTTTFYCREYTLHAQQMSASVWASHNFIYSMHMLRNNTIEHHLTTNRFFFAKVKFLCIHDKNFITSSLEATSSGIDNRLCRPCSANTSQASAWNPSTTFCPPEAILYDVMQQTVGLRTESGSPYTGSGWKLAPFESHSKQNSAKRCTEGLEGALEEARHLLQGHLTRRR